MIGCLIGACFVVADVQLRFSTFKIAALYRLSSRLVRASEAEVFACCVVDLCVQI